MNNNQETLFMIRKLWQGLNEPHGIKNMKDVLSPRQMIMSPKMKIKFTLHLRSYNDDSELVMNEFFNE